MRTLFSRKGNFTSRLLSRWNARSSTNITSLVQHIFFFSTTVHTDVLLIHFLREKPHVVPRDSTSTSILIPTHVVYNVIVLKVQDSTVEAGRRLRCYMHIVSKRSLLAFWLLAYTYLFSRSLSQYFYSYFLAIHGYSVCMKNATGLGYTRLVSQIALR